MRRLFVLPLVILAFQLNAQTKHNLKSGYNIEIRGTSTLHDWEMKSDNSRGYVIGKVENSTLSDVSEINIVVVAESLKSGKSGMDKNAYDAIKTNDYKEITFISKNVNVSGTKVTATGDLFIAGTKKNTTVDAICEVQPNGDIKCMGSKKIKLTEYNVDPPTAMFGSIKTGDDLEIVFDVTFSK